MAAYRLLSMEIFDLSGRDLAALGNFSRKNNLSLFEACEKVEQIPISDKAKETINRLVQMIGRHLDLLKKETAGQIVYYFLEETGYLKKLADYKTAGDERKANNISKFFDKLKTYEIEHEDASVSAVVDWINLSLELGESPLASDMDWSENDAVNLLTVHSAKGLEFPVVFLVNLVSQRFPTTERKEAIPIPDDLIKEILPEGDYHLEEERRLFYVGMTRARDQLYLTAADYYAEGKREKKISPFVYEVMGKKVIDDQPLAANNQLSIFDYQTSKQKPETAVSKPTGLNYLSYSQMATFKICPLQYKYRYLLRIPVPPSAAASFGDTIHQTMRDFYQKAIAGQNPDKEDLLKTLEENWNPLGYTSKAHEKRMILEGRKILQEFFEKSYDPKKLPKALEQIFSVKVSPDLKIGGKIDRIDVGKDGVEIIDYKTGSASSKKDVGKDLQLIIYALVVADGTLEYMGVLDQTPSPEKIKVSFYFFDHQEKISTAKTKKELEEAKKQILELAKKISESDFAPTPGKMCDFCDYKLICEAWK